MTPSFGFLGKSSKLFNDFFLIPRGVCKPLLDVLQRQVGEELLVHPWMFFIVKSLILEDPFMPISK